MNSIKKQQDLEALPTVALLSTFNNITGKSTTKFASRAKGIEQTWKALVADRKAKGLQADGTKVGESPSTPGAKPKQRRIPFRLAPKAEQKSIREGSKRSLALHLLSRANGATVTEVQNHPRIQWDDRTVYEGIRLLNTYCGFGLFSQPEGDTYRVRVVGPGEFAELMNKEAAAK